MELLTVTLKKVLLGFSCCSTDVEMMVSIKDNLEAIKKKLNHCRRLPAQVGGRIFKPPSLEEPMRKGNERHGIVGGGGVLLKGREAMSTDKSNMWKPV